MDYHVHIKPKVTLRNWMREESQETAVLLSAFDSKYEEVTCACAYEDYLSNGPIFMNVRTHELFLGDTKLKIAPKHFKMLEYILRNIGRCITYEELLSNIWGAEHAKDLHYVRVSLSDIRVLLSDEKGRIIKTVPNIGLIMDKIED